MHGSHFHSIEYEISSSRLGSPKKSSESFEFERSKKKSESSPAWKRLKWSLQRTLSTAVLTSILIILGLARSLGSSNMLKLYAGTQLIVAYIAPKLMKVKRGLTFGNKKPLVPTYPPIIEIVPVPFNLVIALDNIYNLQALNNSIIGNNVVTQIISPTHHTFNFTMANSTNVAIEYNASTVFEALAFSLCESYLNNRRKPTKITVVGSSKASRCVLGKYRWALKIPEELLSFQVSNFSRNLYSCPETKKDPFDCKALARKDTRLLFSRLCPELAPFLQACQNSASLERALAHKPSWSIKT